MTESPDEPEALVVRRRIPAPPARVFAAWLDPGSLARWMQPGAATGALVTTDPRVGGRYRIVMRFPDRDVEHSGRYLTIEPPRRLVFTWQSAATDLRETVVTVELRADGDGTALTLTHRQLPPARIEGHRGGWTDVLRKLAEAFPGERKAR